MDYAVHNFANLLHLLVKTSFEGVLSIQYQDRQELVFVLKLLLYQHDEFLNLKLCFHNTTKIVEINRFSFRFDQTLVCRLFLKNQLTLNGLQKNVQVYWLY